MKRILLFIIILCILCFILLKKTFLNNAYTSTSFSDKTIHITTSFYPFYFLASEIAKNRATIKNITPPGAEPHEYEPTAQDILTIQQSEILILHGSLEPWADKISKNLQKERTHMLKVAAEIPTQTYVDEAGTVTNDPHIWLYPVIAKNIADKITDELRTIDPSNSSEYGNNNKILHEKLDILDRAYSDGLKDCKKNTIVTTHAAFGYMATGYHFHQLPIYGVSPDSEPSLQTLTKISDYAKQNDIQYIFFENLVSPKLAEAIANEIGAKTLVLNPLEGLTNQEMKEGKNYLSEMQNNLINLKIALSCQ